MAKTKKQHYIPQFLLRNFSENGKNVLMAEKSLKPKFIPVAVKNAAAENNAHDNETEIRLSKAESRHAEAVREIIGGATIEGTLKEYVYEIASFAMVRSPKNIRAMQSIMHESAIRAKADRNSRHASFLRHLGVFPHDILATQGEIASVMFEESIKIMTADYAKEFEGDNIQVLQATECDFILADCPLSIYRPHNKKTPAGVWVLQHHILILPLSNKIALEFCKEESPHNKRKINKAEVAEINRRSVIMADRFVYAYQKDESVLEIIRKNANYSAGIENVGGYLGTKFVYPPDCDPTKAQFISDKMPPPYQVKADEDD